MSKEGLCRPFAQDRVLIANAVGVLRLCDAKSTLGATVDSVAAAMIVMQ